MKKFLLAVFAASLIISCDKVKMDVKTSSDATDSTAHEEWKPVDSATATKAWMDYATPGEMQKMLAQSDGNWIGETTMWMENGSGGFISDLVFEGGLYGLWVGNQQFTSRNITIRNTGVAAIYLNWDWVWTFQDLHISNSAVGIDVAAGIGSIVLVDSSFENVDIGVRTVFSTESAGEDSVQKRCRAASAVKTLQLQTVHRHRIFGGKGGG